MNSIRQSVRRNIRFFRREKGLTQEELSRECSYSPSYLGKVERGEVDVTLAVMSRVSEVLGISPQELIQHKEGLEEDLPEPGPKMRSANPVFDYAFQNVDHVVGVADAEGRVMLMNDTYGEYYGGSEEDVFEKPVWELPLWRFEGDAEAAFRERFREAAREPGSHLFKLDSPRENPAHLILSHLEDEDEKHRYVVFELLWPSSFPKGDPVPVADLTRLSRW